jgi:hypothetical protein
VHCIRRASESSFVETLMKEPQGVCVWNTRYAPRPFNHAASLVIASLLTVLTCMDTVYES